VSTAVTGYAALCSWVNGISSNDSFQPRAVFGGNANRSRWRASVLAISAQALMELSIIA
jgi:hypothetical protein